MAKPSDEPGFKALQREWYKKLSESGFEDIEHEAPHAPLKRSTSERRCQEMDPISRDARIQYFKRVQHHVATTKFKAPLERDILNLYAQGVSKSMIMRVLGITGSRWEVRYPIEKWLIAWGLKDE